MGRARGRACRRIHSIFLAVVPRGVISPFGISLSPDLSWTSQDQRQLSRRPGQYPGLVR
jgi:hypothetical protein